MVPRQKRTVFLPLVGSLQFVPFQPLDTALTQASHSNFELQAHFQSRVLLSLSFSTVQQG